MANATMEKALEILNERLSKVISSRDKETDPDCYNAAFLDGSIYELKKNIEQLEEKKDQLQQERIAYFQEHFEIRSSYNSTEVLSFNGEEIDYQGSDGFERSTMLEVYYKREDLFVGYYPIGEDVAESYEEIIDLAHSAEYDPDTLTELLRGYHK